jgi:hypothetical protein
VQPSPRVRTGGGWQLQAGESKRRVRSNDSAERCYERNDGQQPNLILAQIELGIPILQEAFEEEEHLILVAELVRVACVACARWVLP